MKTKNTVFKGIILFLLILLCIGAAYAADDTITDNPNLNDASLSLAETSVSQSDSSNSALSQDQSDNGEIETNSESNLASNEIGEGKNIYVKQNAKDGDGSEEKPFGDLKSAISIASDGDTIIVANGSYSGVNNSNLSISQSGLTIKAAEGASPSISGSSARRIFSLTGSNIVLQGLFLTSGKVNSDYGGGVLIASDGVTIKNCTFYNCKAFYGGAVFISGNNVVIDDCEFRGNTALDNKYIAKGGAIYLNGSLSNILINNSRFGVNGYNRADYGGAIFSSSSAVFNNTIFSNNIADSIGGALYVTNGASESIFENCIFNNNAAYGKYFAVTGGGAMAIYGTGNKIINSNFTKNWVTDCGGALMMFRSNNEIINTSFEDNKAGRGGAICLRFVSNDINENNRIIGCNFTGNGKPFSHSTEVLTKGGAIFSYANKTYILDSKFEDNVALSGGAVLFGCDANGNRANNNTIENSTFKNNQAVRYGGGAISSASNGDKILNSTFISNTAKNYGGALSMDYVDVYNSTFTDNMAIEGTAIYAIETYVEGSDFSSNIADNGKGYQKSHLMSSSLQESGEGKVIVGLNKAEVKDSNINDDDVVSLGISTIHQTQYNESLITIDNNYIGYCAEKLCDQSMDGVILENLSIFRNSLDSSNVADYLKVLVWEYFKGTSDEDSLQKQVTIFTDEDYLNSEDPIVKDVIAKVNSGMRIASENAIKILEDGKIIAYNFKALVTPQATQNVFIFNLSEVNETVVKETLTPVVVKGEEAKFNITVTNNGENNITGVFINDSDFDPQLIYSSFESDSEDYDWTYNESSKIWILNKTLEPGQSASIIISFETTESGEFRNNVSSGLGNHTFSNSSNVTKVISPNMTIEKISNNQTVEVGEKVSFTITVKNTGDCNLTGVYITDKDYSDGLTYDSFVDSTGKWSFDGKDTWNYDGELEVGESASIEIIFVASTAGEKVNTAIAGNNITNDTVNSTNTTNVTEVPEENTTNDTNDTDDVPEEDIPEDVLKETPKKTVKVANATGNPLFALVAVLVILFGMPLRRRK